MKESPGPWEWLRVLLFLPEEASSYAGAVDRLHYFVILTTFVASTAIGLCALFFMVRYQRRSETPTTPKIVAPGWMEVLIVVVPLSFFLLWFALGFPLYIHLTSPPKDAMDVYVTGKQWMWKFAYPDGPNGLDVLRVPVGRPVRVLLTSRDVIHSFYVPSFRIKRDAVPGRYAETWFQVIAPGRYEVLCAEYCGTSHSLMRAEVVAMPKAEFDAWLESEKQGPRARTKDTPGPDEPVTANMAQQGRDLAVRFECLRCHTIDGSPHIGPTWLGLFGRSELLDSGSTALVNEAYITESIMDPLAKIVAGYRPVMPTYQGRLDAPDTGAIVEYIKTLRTAELKSGPPKAPTYEPIPGR